MSSWLNKLQFASQLQRNHLQSSPPNHATALMKAYHMTDTTIISATRTKNHLQVQLTASSKAHSHFSQPDANIQPTNPMTQTVPADVGIFLYCHSCLNPCISICLSITQCLGEEQKIKNEGKYYRHDSGRGIVRKIEQNRAKSPHSVSE